MTRWICIPCLAATMLFAIGHSSAQEKSSRPTFKEVEKQVNSLKVTNVPWRKIPWKTTLLEGLKESRQKKKPVILWVFIDRPIDDERC